MKKDLCLVLMCILVASCATGYHYNFSLLSVDRPQAAAAHSGPLIIEQTADSTAMRYRFRDSLIEGTLSINMEQFELCEEQDGLFNTDRLGKSGLH